MACSSIEIVVGCEDLVWIVSFVNVQHVVN